MQNRVTDDDRFGEALRAARHRAGFTQRDLAEHMGVAPRTISAWEVGRHRPFPSNVDELGRFLDASEELQGAAMASPESHARAHAAPSPAVRDVSEVQRTLGRLLLEHLVKDKIGKPIGWRRDFRDDVPPTAFTTASAVRLLCRLQHPPYIDRHALGDSLLAFRLRDGWATRGEVRPESTVAVIDALDLLGAPLDVDRSLSDLESMLRRKERSQTYVLVESLAVAARLRPEGAFTRALLEALLSARVPAHVAWPEKQPPVPGTTPPPSTAHTARVVLVLSEALEGGLPDSDDRVSDVLDAARQWLTENASLDIHSENTEPGNRADLEIRHFTPALVAQAVASCWPLSEALLHSAIAKVWASYEPTLGRWLWPTNSDMPLWLQDEALRAIMLANSRLTGLPSG